MSKETQLIYGIYQNYRNTQKYLKNYHMKEFILLEGEERKKNLEIKK